MKVIKHLKHDTPEHRLKLFFKEMPLLTRLLLPLITIVSIILWAVGASRSFRAYSFLDSRPLLEMILLLVIGLTDFQKEERRGSLFFLISYIIKTAGFNKLIQAFMLLVGVKPDFFATTSYPVLYCFMIAFRNMVMQTNQQRYFLIASFTIKYLFYPIFLAILLELAGFRVDIMSTLMLSLLITAIKLDELIAWLSKKLDKKLIGNRALSWGLLETGCPDIALSQVDRVTTNHSIVIAQQ